MTAFLARVSPSGWVGFGALVSEVTALFVALFAPAVVCDAKVNPLWTVGLCALLLGLVLIVAAFVVAVVGRWRTRRRAWPALLLAASALVVAFAAFDHSGRGECIQTKGPIRVSTALSSAGPTQ